MSVRQTAENENFDVAVLRYKCRKIMKVNDIVDFVAEDYGNAETVGVAGGVTVFVPFLCVGERAKVKINHVKGKVAYGDVVTVVERSPKREEPRCPYYGVCGGCSLMHMKYAEQLSFKQRKVQRNLTKIGKLDGVAVGRCVPSPHVFAYRNKLSLPVSGTVGNVKIGMYKRGTHEVVDMNNCLLGGLWSKKLVELFRDYLKQNEIAPYDEKTFSGEVRHIVARYIDGQLLAVVVSNGEFAHDLTEFYDTLSKNFDKVGLFVNINSGKNNVILGKITRHIAGLRYIESTHLGTTFRLRPDSFFQVNNEVKNAIYTQVRQMIDVADTEVLVDCFSGVGVLTNVLCSDAYDTYAVEIVPSAVKDADEMAALNHSPRLTNILGDANEVLPRLTAQNAGKRMTLVVDPPRKGLGEGICNTICKANFNNVAYISCDSATLARDLSMLSSRFEVLSATPYDMFPNTDQVETVVLLARRA